MAANGEDEKEVEKEVVFGEEEYDVPGYEKVSYDIYIRYEHMI